MVDTFTASDDVSDRGVQAKSADRQHVPDLVPLSVGVLVTVVAVNGQTARVAISGELDFVTSHDAADSMLTAMTSAVNRVEIDAGGLDFCDVAGLRFFLEFDRRCAERGGELRIVNPRWHLIRLLDLTGTKKLLAKCTKSLI